MKQRKGEGELVVILMIGIVIAAGMWIVPNYNVWARNKAGEAELSQATYNRQIAVREAEAKRDASKALAAAEIERAKGVATANKIIGDSLKGNEDYLRYLYINNLAEKNGETIIYVPTENALPVLEAGRAGNLKKPVGPPKSAE